MKVNKLSVTLAALVLGVQLGSPVAASISAVDMDKVEQVIAAGDTEGLLALIALYPELLSIEGVVGDAIRAFAANPSEAALAAIAAQSGGDLSVALTRAMSKSGTSIY